MRKKLGIVLALCFLLCGCTKEPGNEPQVGSPDSSLLQVQNEASECENKYETLDIGNAEIIIPEADTLYKAYFDIGDYDQDEVEQSYIDNLKKLSNGEEIDTDKIVYHMWRSEEEGPEYVNYNEASENEHKFRESALLYNHKGFSEVLYKSSYMCEMADYKRILEIKGEEDEENIWGYRVLDMGTLEKNYDVLHEDISEVSYNLCDGPMNLKEAVDYMEQHVKNDYRFVGSKLLDYKVYKVKVMKLKDGIYYYQFHIQPEYKGIPLNKDYAPQVISGEEDSDEDIERFGVEYVASMVENNKLNYVWSCAHSYENVEELESYDKVLSLSSACIAASQQLSTSTKLKVGRIELVYDTVFKKKDGVIQGVEIKPIYHFVITNPDVLGYTAIYIDVDAITGQVLITKM
ncbi:MAG: hypothetical protein UEY44_07120 [Coprococcus sp.]|nr:hypothetical protein [Coprococcus sp.]